MKKKKSLYSFRNDKNNFFALLGDNKKVLMPLLFIIAVALTVGIALSANHRTAQEASTEADPTQGATLEIPDGSMEENAYPEVNALIEKYYQASANGDSDTIASIYKGLEETELLKAVAAADYIEDYQNITVYTKPGPVAGSYVAYVYNEVKLYDYDKAIPGLETFYICTDDNGQIYINGDIADSSEIDYLKQINLQADVIDLNNRVATSYNDMVNSDEKLAEILTTMRSGLQVSVGEALASSEASAAESSEESEETEEETQEEGNSESSDVTVKKVTTRTIKATDVINIRKSDSETADIISKTSAGDEFKELEALANGWSKIEYNGSVAYVKTEFFEVVDEETVEVIADSESPKVATGEDNADNNASAGTTVASAVSGKMVTIDTVRLRKSQSTDAEVLEVVYKGSEVNVIEQYANGWSKVEYGKKNGYIKSEYLKKE